MGTGFDTKRYALAEHRLATGHPTDALATLADADPDDVIAVLHREFDPSNR